MMTSFSASPGPWWPDTVGNSHCSPLGWQQSACEADFGAEHRLQGTVSQEGSVSSWGASCTHRNEDSPWNHGAVLHLLFILSHHKATQASNHYSGHRIYLILSMTLQ